MELDLKEHFQRLRSWLEMEGEAERERLAQRMKVRNSARAEKTGETLLDLVLVDSQPGLGGRFLLRFAKRTKGAELPWTRLRVGSPVILSVDDPSEESSCFGVVSQKDPRTIQVACEEWPDAPRYRLDHSADEVTRSRQLAALRQIEQIRGRSAQLRDILLGQRPVRFDPLLRPLEIAPHCNPSQREAVEFAMMARDLAILHGPPGTGKTTTVVEVIRQSVLQGQKVLACAPSNTAVDHLLEELVGCGLEAVRIGHPARVAPILQQHTLDALAQEDPANEIVHQLMRDAERAMRKAERWTRSRPMPGQKHQHRAEARQLREDAKLLQRQIIESILDRAEVICATTTFDPEVLGDRWFDLAVVDEACQSTEPGSWPCVLRAERLVLAGDHCQLPPTVLSKPAAQEGFSISLMERLVRDVCPDASRRLTIQYRMHESIMSFSSKEFYDGTLTADSSVASHTLNDLPGITPLAWTENPLRWIDTAGAGWEEEQEPDGESRMNRKEADLVAWLARQWTEAGNAPEALAVIAPYAAQVRLLRQRLSSLGIEVDTVDGFQGREKEAILISMVRSNNSGEIGFLADTRRMNVAITRARRLLVLIGDSATVTCDPFFGRLMEHVERRGIYQSVWEYPEVM